MHRSFLIPATTWLVLFCGSACGHDGAESESDPVTTSGNPSATTSGNTDAATSGETNAVTTSDGSAAEVESTSGATGVGGSSASASGGADGSDETGSGTAASTGSGGDSGSAGASTDGAGADTGTGGTAGVGGSSGGSSLGPPDYETEFVSDAGWSDRSDPTGSVTYGASGGHDGNVAVLTFPGDPALGAEDNASPSHASEIDWEERLYGTFRTRLELARCASGEEVVNGIFTYSHGGDSNDNGITDNNEIDIEILCGEPYIIFLSSWTDYDDDTSFRKWSRAVDTRSGDYRESPSATEYGLGPVLGNIPGANVPGFPEAGRFYEMGFEWQPDHIRWFIVFDTEEVTLWDLTDASLIAQNPASFLFNVWHAPTHWFEGGAADYPASDAVMRIDWFRYWGPSMSFGEFGT